MKFTNFIRNKSGATITMFGLTMVPLILFGALAMEYSLALSQQSRVQSGLDSAAIAAAALPGSVSDADRIAIAQSTFAANMATQGTTATATFTVVGTKIQASAEMPVDSILSNIIGNSNYVVGSNSEVQFRAEEFGEIALVLDYSSSMNGQGKWQAMRDAAINLVNKVSENGTKPGIKFGLVPFTKMVRTTMANDYVIGQGTGGNWTGCTQDRKWPHNTTDNPPILTNDDTKWGLLPSASGTCNQMAPHNLTIMRLTNNIPNVLAQLNAMDPHVGTHISLGLAFGWRLVSPFAPFADGVAYGTNGTLKSIVLLTDGKQSTKAWGQFDTYKKDNGETNLETLCTNIKAKSIVMITIAFDINDNDTRNRLRNCATSHSYYFNADNNAELAVAFESITRLLKGRLYVSK